jgi:hypothetical protein
MKDEITDRFLGKGRPFAHSLYNEGVIFLKFKDKLEYKPQPWWTHTEKEPLKIARHGRKIC